MNHFASPPRLRMSLFRWALFVIPAIMLLGYISGTISGSSEENSWFRQLSKPEAQPPGWVFGTVWPILYFMTALAVAMILNASNTRYRGLAIGLFLAQLFLNLIWSPIFFGQHQVTTAFYLIIAIVVIAIATTAVFGRIRKAAAWLMLPYLCWLCFAAILNFQIDRLNPDAESLYVPAATSQIGNES